MRKRRSSGLKLRKNSQEQVEAGVLDIMNKSTHQNVAMGQKVITAEAEYVEVEQEWKMKEEVLIVTEEEDLVLAEIWTAEGELKIGGVAME
jgi:hypothetical protein